MRLAKLKRIVVPDVQCYCQYLYCLIKLKITLDTRITGQGVYFENTAVNIFSFQPVSCPEYCPSESFLQLLTTKSNCPHSFTTVKARSLMGHGQYAIV